MCPRTVSTVIYTMTSLFLITVMFASHIYFSHIVVISILLLLTVTTLIQTSYFIHQDLHSDCVKTTDRIFEDFYMLVAGALVTFILVKMGLSAILASALVGAIGSLLLKQSALAIFTGSFVGMTSIHIFTNLDLLVAAIIAGILFSFGKEAFPGIGGKLGTTAFFGALPVLLVRYPSTFDFFNDGIDVTHLDFSTGFIVLLIALSAIAAYLTYFLSDRWLKNIVLSSSLVAIFAELTLHFIMDTNAGVLSAAIYCATFAGMSTKKRLHPESVFLLAGALSGFIYFNSSPIFVGIGGKMGTSGFIASMAAKMITDYSNKMKNII